MAATSALITVIDASTGVSTVEAVDANIFGNEVLSSRPASGANVGDIFIVLDTANSFFRWDIWDGSAWQQIESKKSNRTATTDPTVGDDSGDGYDVGSIWVNTTSDEVFICADSSSGAAVWQSSAGGSVPTWAQTLASGSSSGGTDPLISDGDSIVGEDNGAGDGGNIPITAGSSTGGGGDGGDILLTPGSGNGAGVDGIVQVNGPKHYASSATDPTSPTPADGDRYYNTTLDMEMRYDATRAKWLSVETATFHGSDAGALTNGTYQQIGNMRMTSVRGWEAIFDGTIVALGWTRNDSDASSWDVTLNGTTAVSVATAAQGGRDVTLNTDVTQGQVVGIRNGGPNTMSNTSVWLRVKWRA